MANQKPLLFYCSKSEDVELCIEWNRFREKALVTVYNQKQVDLAKSNGLGSVFISENVNIQDEFMQNKPDYVLVTGTQSKTAMPTIPTIDQISVEEFGRLDSAKSRNERQLPLYMVQVTNEKEAEEFIRVLKSPIRNDVVIHTSLEGFEPLVRSPFRIIDFQPPKEILIGGHLRKHKHRISILEATTGGLVAASLLSVPGASSFFISGATVYTGRGAKRILPDAVLKASALFNRENNYANRTNYEESKRRYCLEVSKAMRVAMKADFCLVESGTTGPDFYIPGVQAFTSIGVAGPNDFVRVKFFDSPTRDRRQNMADFKEFALQVLMDSLKEYESLYPLEKTRTADSKL